MAQEVMLNELDLFKRSNFQASIESSNFIQYRPISTITDGSTIEFDIPVAADEYLDLRNVFIFIKGQVVGSDGNALAAASDNRYSICNFAANTIFDQMSAYLNGTLVSQSSRTHHYMSIIQALTKYDIRAVRTLLEPGGFHTTFGDDTINDHDAINADLHRLVRRSKIFTLCAKLFGDIFTIDRLLCNGLTLHIALSRAPNSFIFRGTDAVAAAPNVAAVAAVHPRLNLRECLLYVRKVKPSPNIITAHAKILHMNKAIYPYTRTNVKVINLPANQNTFMCDNIYMNQLPVRLICGLVSGNAFSGTYGTNAFAFKPFNATFICVHRNGEVYPKTPYQPDFTENVMNIQREYFEFLLNLGVDNGSITPPIDMTNWSRGHCLYAFNFDSTFQENNDFISLGQEGFLGIEIRLRAAQPNPLKLIVYGEFNNNIEIDEGRNVTVDFS